MGPRAVRLIHGPRRAALQRYTRGVTDDAPDEDWLDLHTAFAARGTGEITLELHAIGTLVHDGQIVASDPLVHSEQRPFARGFPPGAHPVEVLVTRERKDERVALARIVFAPGVPVSFELATRGDEDLRALSPGQRFAYGVDAGTGCFSAAGAQDEVDSDAMLADLEAHQRFTWSWATALPSAGGHRMIAFSSGYGDGTYASYVGVDAVGAPLCLITDFGCLRLLRPPTPDDPAFRRAHVDAMYARMKELAPQLGGAGRGEAYRAAGELRTLPGDALHLVMRLVGDLRATRDVMQRDLYLHVLTALLDEPTAQRIVAPHLARLPVEVSERLLIAAREVDPEWLAALRAMWSVPMLRSRILAAELRAAANDPINALHAAEALSSNDPKLTEMALRALEDQTDRPPAVLDEIRKVAATSTQLRVRIIAFRILSGAGEDLEEALAAADPETRLAAASAVARATATPRADAVLAALVDDPNLDLELRFHAAGTIRDRSMRIAAYLAAGLAGHWAAPIQLHYVGGPEAIAALERLVAETRDATVLEQAQRHLKSTRELQAHRERP